MEKSKITLAGALRWTDRTDTDELFGAVPRLPVRRRSRLEM